MYSDEVFDPKGRPDLRTLCVG